jgi:hypothetical protein
MIAVNLLLSMVLICPGLSQPVFAQSSSEPGTQECGADWLKVVGS